MGDLTLAYEALDLAADTGLRLNAYIAEPGTASAEAFGLLASWATTLSHGAELPITPPPGWGVSSGHVTIYHVHGGLDDLRMRSGGALIAGLRPPRLGDFGRHSAAGRGLC